MSRLTYMDDDGYECTLDERAGAVRMEVRGPGGDVLAKSADARCMLTVGDCKAQVKTARKVKELFG